MVSKEIEIKDIGIVVPYYKSELSETEKISFEQCQRILGRYSIILVVPDSMCRGNYPCGENLIIEKVPCEWMQSTASYNEMMMNEAFYMRFSQYQYILIYQLDAFVFSDKLREFCQYGYDYIGAPWIYGYFYYVSSDKCVWKVGNGGLSLRKVDSFLKLLKKESQAVYTGNEDVFFSISDGENFKVAPLDVALKFAFEREVERCFELNNEKLPFGCHAWERYNLKFWKPFIEAFGYRVNMVFLPEDKVLENMYDESRRKTALFLEMLSDRDKFTTAVHELLGGKKNSYIVWGAGYYGKMVSDIFVKMMLPIKFIIDNNLEVGREINGISIKKYYEADIAEKDVILVAVKNSREIVCQLEKDHYVYLEDYFLLNDLKKALSIP